ncbi:hypothetical protein JCM33374_g6478 [Metschnikowia sp. JCM 33374]|nr:hypothetical protein JCM33374_g6478 [Metschnikowia sp. JCM 33374]
MNFLISVLVFCGLACANAPGSLAIAILSSNWYNKDLCVNGNVVKVCEKGSTFSFNNDGSMKVVGDNMFLRVEENGVLGVGSEPQHDFSLHIKMLKYHEDPKFYLCDDGVLGRTKTATCSRPATLYYEPLA